MTCAALARSLPALALAALAMTCAHGADRGIAYLQVTAEVVPSCRFEAKVPRMGTPDRANGTASFSVTCTRAANATAVACAQRCTPEPQQDAKRTEYRVVENRDDGTALATVLF